MSNIEFSLGIFKEPKPVLNFESVTTNAILKRGQANQQFLRQELIELLHSAFPAMPENIVDETVSEYFHLPNLATRSGFLIRNDQNNLVAASFFDLSQINFNDRIGSSVYILERLVHQSIQELGLGGLLAQIILSFFQPDVLLTTCAQTISLWSWINTIQKGRITGYEIYPRIENNQPVFLPCENQTKMKQVFRQAYLGVAGDNVQKVENKMVQLDSSFVRRGVYTNEPLYSKQPWSPNDKIAQALQLTPQDGILVVCVKK